MAYRRRASRSRYARSTSYSRRRAPMRRRRSASRRRASSGTRTIRLVVQAVQASPVAMGMKGTAPVRRMF